MGHNKPKTRASRPIAELLDAVDRAIDAMRDAAIARRKLHEIAKSRPRKAASWEAVVKLDPADLRDLEPLISAAVRSTLEQIESQRAKLDGRLGYPEAEAAELLGVARHVLRDARLRGEIHARKVGSRYVYARSALEAYLCD